MQPFNEGLTPSVITIPDVISCRIRVLIVGLLQSVYNTSERLVRMMHAGQFASKSIDGSSCYFLRKSVVSSILLLQSSGCITTLKGRYTLGEVEISTLGLI